MKAFWQILRLQKRAQRVGVREAPDLEPRNTLHLLAGYWSGAIHLTFPLPLLGLIPGLRNAAKRFGLLLF